MNHKRNIPVDIVLAPEWWNKNTGITFDRDFFFHPIKRVESEQRMEKELYDRWGKYGLGTDKDKVKPEIGAIHLAAGFFLSEIMGCEVEYSEKHPPLVYCNNRDDLKIDVEGAFKTKAFKNFETLCDTLKAKHSYLTGDVNWGGILNIAMDIRGQQLFPDRAMEDKNVQTDQFIFLGINLFETKNSYAIEISYLSKRPAIPCIENFAFFIRFISGSSEKFMEVMRSAFSKMVFPNIAPEKSQFLNSELVKSVSVKSTS